MNRPTDLHWSPAGHFFTIYVLHHSVNGGEPWIRHWPKGVQKLGEDSRNKGYATFSGIAKHGHGKSFCRWLTTKVQIPLPFWVEGRFKRQIYQMADASFLDFISLNGWTQDSSETISQSGIFKIYDYTDTARFHPGCPRSKRLSESNKVPIAARWLFVIHMCPEAILVLMIPGQ